MRKMLKRYLSLCLSLCMLVMAMPSISLAEDGDAFIGTPEPSAAAEITPAATETTPAAEEPTPAAEEPTPAAAETTPAAGETTSAAEEPTPAAEETTPAAEEPTPAAAETTPAAVETTPAAAEITPAAGETTPAAGESTPAAEEPTPAAEEPTPAAEEPTPAAEEPTPAAGEPTPTPEEPTPAAEEPTPTAEEPTPTAEEPTPAAGETTPAAEEPTPTAGEPTPAAGETTPAAGESTPAAGEPTPAAEEPTPTPAEPTPAAGEPTPAAEEPTPTPGETTPASAGTTPASGEPTPAAAEPTPAAEEPTPAAGETTPAAGETTPAADATATAAPAPVIVELTGAPETMEAMYGLYEDELDLPETLTAVYSDSTRAKLSVSWVCISDGLGGTAYDGECEDYEQACFTFEARLPEGALCAEDLILPRVQVRLVLSNFGASLFTMSEDPTITNTHGVLSYAYTAPEGVTVTGQQWLLNGNPIAGATGTTYTLTMYDMDNDSDKVLSVQLALNDGNTVNSADYPMSLNSQWKMDETGLTIYGDYDHSTTQFPINCDGWEPCAVSVSNGVTVTGVTLKGIPDGLKNYGTIEESYIESEALCNNGTITGSTLKIRYVLENSGNIYDSEITCTGTVENDAGGTIEVPVTIDGKYYRTTGNHYFCYGGNTKAALAEWYATYIGENSDLVWLDENGNDVAEQSFGLSGNSFTLLGRLSYRISTPAQQLYEGNTIRAEVDTDIKDVELTYKWTKIDEGTLLGTEAELTLQGNGYNVQLEITATVPGKGSVTRKLTLDGSQWTVRKAVYSVSVDYENENLVIKPLGVNTFTEVRMTVNNTMYTKTINPDDKSLTVSLEQFQSDTFQVVLEVLLGSDALESPRILNFTRAAADVCEEDFAVDVAPPANAGAARNVTISCSAPDRYKEFRVKKERYPAGTAATVECSAGEDVAVEARIPGSNEAWLLPSVWSNAATIEGTKWLYLNVSSVESLSTKALYWGEWLLVKSSPNATLTWKINGEDVDAPTLNRNTYIIPADVSSLSITATDETGSVTWSESGITSPLLVSLDYENEQLVLKKAEYCYPGLSVRSGSKSKSVDSTPVYWDLSEFGYPTDQENVLTLFVWTDFSDFEIPVTIPARFEGSPAYGSVGYQDLSFNSELKNVWRVTVTTADSEGVRYAAVKVVDSAGESTDFISNGAVGNWYPGEGVGLRGDSSYSIYAKQYSVDAEGKQNSFVSDWFDTGVRFTPCTLTLSTTEPLVGDTVTATIPDSISRQQLTDEMRAAATFKWYYVNGNGDCTEIGSGRGFTILPGSGYENCRLRVVAFDLFTGKAIGYAETEVIPAPEIVIKCDGKELEKSASGVYTAYLGDKLTAEVTNVSDALNKSWTWDNNGTGFCDTANLEVDESVCSLRSGTASLTLGSGSNVETLSRLVRFYLSPAPAVTIDYENEALIAVKPDDERLAGYKLVVSSPGFSTSLFDGDADNKYTAPIASIQSGWPDNYKHKVDLIWASNRTSYNHPVSEKATVWVPARPTVQMPTVESAAFAVTVKDVSTQEYNFRLVASGGDVTAESVGTMTEDAANRTVRFTGLEQSTQYSLWVQKKATSSSFRSEWAQYTVFTRSGGEAQPAMTSTDYHLGGISLSEDDVKALLKLRVGDGPLLLAFRSTDVTLTRADGKPFPITDAGTYKLKVTLNGDLACFYRLKYDTVTLTVNPYKVEDYDFASLKTYRGAAYDPYDFQVKVGEYVLSKDDYDITVDGGLTLRDAGEYTARIVFKGNYESDLDGVVYPRIEPFELCAIAEPQDRVYDGTTAIDCTAGWDSCAPFEGDDVTVRASGTMEDKKVGTGKNVRVTLSLEGAQSGNYVLESATLSSSADIEKKQLTLSPEQPADFEYNGSTDVPLTGEGWTLDGVVAGDDVRVDTANASAAVSDPNAGGNKAVTFTGWTLDGADRDNYTVAGEEPRSVTIAKAKPPAIDWPTAGDITYGQCLADSTLSHTRDANGAFAWEKPDHVPTSADEWAFNMIYTPDDAANYAYREDDLRKTVNIAVNMATPPEIQWPGADSITYGMSLAESGLTSSDTHGSFAWVTPDEKPGAGRHSFAVRYTPDDAKNYDYTGVTLEKDVAVTVIPADAPEIQWPTASEITYGSALSASVLTSEDANGTFAWKNPDEKPSAGTRNYVVVYTPNNASDYNYGEGVTSIEKGVSVTVNKAESTIDVSGVGTEYTYTGELQRVNSGATLNHGECALVYANNSFTTVAEGDGLTVKITAEETDNYLAAEAVVTIHVARAEAPKLILPAATRLTYGRKLSESALTGSEDAPGSFAWEDGDQLLPAGVNACNVVFTPDDPDNYVWTQEILVQKIEVIVDQKPVSMTVGNASKTYGDADPKAQISVSGVLDGDSLDYSVSRRSGEDVGAYAYIVDMGSNPNYKPDVLPGTLTIQPRSIADGALSISAVGDQMCTMQEIRPEPTLRFGDEVLVQGTDYVLSYSNNVRPGRATITITGKGNFSGSYNLDFTIIEGPAAPPTATPAVTPTAAPAPLIAPISNEALQKYLDDMGSLVFDAEYESVDFVQIPVLVSGEEQEGILLICASQEESGEPAQRSLILNAAQLIKLQQALQENKISDLIFENGSAAARMNLAELTGGNMAKLMALILSGEEITDEILQSDWSEMEDAALTEAEYERFSLEVRIVPVVQEDGELGFEISIWLHCDALKLNVSDLIDSLCVMLDVSQLVTEENVDSCEGMYAITQRYEEEIELLDSALVLAPTVSGDDNAEKSETPTVTGRYALTALYAGEGIYRAAARQAR